MLAEFVDQHPDVLPIVDRHLDQVHAAGPERGLERGHQILRALHPRALHGDVREWEDKLALMAEQALASGSPGNNPRVPEVAEIVALYREVWESGRNA